MNVLATRRNGNNAAPSAGNGNRNDRFLKLLPAVKLHAQIQFRNLPYADKEEAISESVAAAFCNYTSACQRGKEHVVRPSTLAHYSVLNVKAGRHPGGSWESKTDAMSRVAQRKHGFRVYRVADVDGYAFDCMTAPEQPVWKDRLLYDRRTSPADLACFRIDWSRFLAGQTDRTRVLLGMLGSGHRSVEIADRLGITASAICQRRKKAAREWASFQGDTEPGSAVQNDKAAPTPAGGASKPAPS